MLPKKPLPPPSFPFPAGNRPPVTPDRPKPLPKLSALKPPPKAADPDADLPVALTIHKSLVTYIGGEMNERNMTAAEAALFVFEEARQHPQFAAENADMLDGFDPINNPLTADDVAAIEAAARGLREFDRKFGHVAR